MSLVTTSSVIFIETVLVGVMGRMKLLENENRCQWG